MSLLEIYSPGLDSPRSSSPELGPPDLPSPEMAIEKNPSYVSLYDLGQNFGGHSDDESAVGKPLPKVPIEGGASGTYAPFYHTLIASTVTNEDDQVVSEDALERGLTHVEDVDAPEPSTKGGHPLNSPNTALIPEVVHIRGQVVNFAQSKDIEVKSRESQSSPSQAASRGHAPKAMQHERPRGTKTLEHDRIIDTVSVLLGDLQDIKAQQKQHAEQLQELKDRVSSLSGILLLCVFQVIFGKVISHLLSFFLSFF
ncbi:hypothetical protein LIA77_12001 [Sarocladium implicatum]|nr:hypothetical protein LIA77_12001 [Sarocladium implicatum]